MNKSFFKVSEMLEDNEYAVLIAEGYYPDYFHIYTSIEEIHLEILQLEDNERVLISGIIKNRECYEDIFYYNENNSWKVNVADFYRMCAKVFGKAAEEYMLYNLHGLDIDSLTINR